MAGYKIEVEIGASLEPIIGRYAILITACEPESIKEGDIVTVFSSFGRYIVPVRKLIVEVSCEDTLGNCYIHLMDGRRQTDWGWYPAEAIRSKVVCIVFRGFISNTMGGEGL